MSTPTFGYRLHERRRHDRKGLVQGVLLHFAPAFRSPLQEYAILRFLVRTTIARPKLAAAVALLMLAALASAMTYAGFLVVGVLADYLGSGRVVAGMLLALVFARFPWVSKGKLRIVGLLPKPARRPLMVGLLALCCLTLLSRSDYLPAAFTGFATMFVLTYPWLRKTIFDRTVGSFFKSAVGQAARKRDDDTVIDGEFREKKE